MIVNTERGQSVSYQADELSFRVLLCLEGTGTLNFETEELHVKKGDCIFFPANSVKTGICGQMQLLEVRG